MSEYNIFKVLADEQRRDILVMLKDGDMSAGDIAKRLDISPAGLSYHLRLLKGAGLVLEYKRGNFVFYELDTSVFNEMIMWINQFGGIKNEKADMDNSNSADSSDGGSDTVYA